MPRHQRYIEAPNFFPPGMARPGAAVVGVYLYEDEAVEWQMVQGRQGAMYAIGYTIRKRGKRVKTNL